MLLISLHIKLYKYTLHLRSPKPKSAEEATTEAIEEMKKGHVTDCGELSRWQLRGGSGNDAVRRYPSARGGAAYLGTGGFAGAGDLYSAAAQQDGRCTAGDDSQAAAADSAGTPARKR